MSRQENFSAFLTELVQVRDKYLIVICAKDNIGRKLTDELADLLLELGLKIDLSAKHGLLGKCHRPYIAVLNKGVLVAEALGAYYDKNALYNLFETDLDGVHLIAKSTVWYKNLCFNAIIDIDGTNYIANHRGLNFVVYDTERKSLVESCAYDTYIDSCDRKNFKLRTNTNLWLKRMALTGAFGGSLFDWFVDNEIDTVDIYGNDEVLESLYEQAFWKGVKINGVYSDLGKTFTVVTFESSDFTKHNDLNRTSRGTTFTLKSKNINSRDSNFPLVSFEKPIGAPDLSRLFNYTLLIKVLINPVLEYMKKQAPNLKVVLYWPVTQRSASVVKRDVLKAQLPDHTDDEIDMIMRKACYSKHGNDRSIINCPQSPKNYVYILGISYAQGWRAANEYCFQNILQNEMNEHFGKDNPYLVNDISGDGGFPAYRRLANIFADIKPKNGDVLVLMPSVLKAVDNIPKKYYSHIFEINLICEFPGLNRQLEDSRNDARHALLLDRVHPSPRGYEVFGKCLFRSMLDKGVFNKPAELAPLAGGGGYASAIQCRGRICCGACAVQRRFTLAPAKNWRDRDELQPVYARTSLLDRVCRATFRAAVYFCRGGR